MPPHAGYSYLSFGPPGDSQGKKLSRPRGEEISSVRSRSSRRGRGGPKQRCRRRPSPSTASPYVAPPLRNAQRRRAPSNKIGTSRSPHMKLERIDKLNIGRGGTRAGMDLPRPHFM